MKKSNQVPATLIVAVAASLAAAGCNSNGTGGQCVDAQGRMLVDSACRGGSVGGAHWIPSRTVTSGGFGSSGSSSSSSSFGS